MTAADILDGVRVIADRFAADRQERQRRRELDPADFDELAAAGFLLTGVPVDAGGVFEDVTCSTRPISEILRTLAHGDASVALVSSMHPIVLAFWNATPARDRPEEAAWAAQCDEVVRLGREHWFGTITSEPGSGGDVANTKAIARRAADGTWRLTGEKHFGSGSGISSFMLTSALPEGEDQPAWFYLDMRDVPWDGSQGVTLTAPWDGHGMTATQSHGMRFEEFPAVRTAWPHSFRVLSDGAWPFVATAFTAVILGVVESAIELAREQLSSRGGSLRPYDQVEWTNAEQDAWLMHQAYEGMLRATETGADPLRTTLLGKTAAARLAEDCLRRITRIVGGGTFARRSPLGFWFEDVRALGFLRPPWGLAYDALHASSWPDEGA